MKDFSLFLFRWRFALFWMVVIIVASTEIGSASTTYRLLKPIIDWLYQGRPQPNVYDINIVLRKTMHVIEFAILAILVWQARARLDRPLRLGTWGGIIFAMSVVIAFAMGSEFIQLFMKHRGASFSDVMLNTAAGGLGLLLLASGKGLYSLFGKKCPPPSPQIRVFRDF